MQDIELLPHKLSLHSLGDDIATVKRAIEQLGKPTILVGHSYGGILITNAGYNNPNVTGLVYITALAPDEDESSIDLFEILPQPENVLQIFTNNIITDSGGFPILTRTNLANGLLRTFIQMRQTYWPQCKSQPMNPLPLKNLVQLHGNKCLPGFRSLRMI
jgi:pimeloyl-ACP methyl ester carboxylesterase